MNDSAKLETESKVVLKKYVLAAATTGAIPVPAASAALVAENCALLGHISSIYGCTISLGSIARSMGALASVNIIGRNVFLEAARWLSWGAAFTGAPVLVSVIGASTAGLQTYLIGLVAIEIGKRGGNPLSVAEMKRIMRSGKDDFDSFSSARGGAA
jgi:uncharacterized protein (DUF697 family)